MGFKILFGEIADDKDAQGVVVGRSSATEVDLDDLSPDVFEEIAAAEPFANFWSVYNFPAQSPERMYRVICAAAAHAGIDVPDRATTMRAANAQNEMFERVEDIKDQPMEGGFPPSPDATEASSSSGAPDDTDGPPTSSGDNPSVTS